MRTDPGTVYKASASCCCYRATAYRAPSRRLPPSSRKP